MPRQRFRREIARRVATGALALALAAGLEAQSASPEVTAATIAEWMKELSNWGRWGGDDQLGTLNLITPEKRREAAALVSEGVSVSLARDVEKTVADDNPNPFEHEMLSAGMDRYAVRYHGFAHTHLDSLCHFADGGVMYNGVSQDQTTDEGCGKLSVANAKDGIFTRGVLVDLAWAKGVDYLEPGTAIYPEDLDAWERKSGVRIQPGDAVFFRTGRWARRRAMGAWNIGANGAGLHASCARWLKERDVALVGSDFGTDVQPSRVEGQRFPMHTLLIVADGDADLRQRRPRSAEPGVSRARSLGVPPHRGPARRTRRDRIAAEPDRDVLDPSYRK